MKGLSTKTDPAASEWGIDDLVMRLRAWGTDLISMLPASPVSGWMVGAGPGCALRLHDPSGQVSRIHASLIHDQARWLLRDAGSKNGMRLDGARRAEIILEPGVEIGIGGLTLIAESRRSIALRGFLARMLGWRGDRTAVVDHALRAVRMAVTRRAPLVVCGEGDLVPIARSLHRRALGDERPFVVCDPRRRRSKATVRSAENHETGLQALAAAWAGSLCVRNRRLPRDFDEVIAVLRLPETRVHLVLCAGHTDDCRSYLATPIIVPPLAGREIELDRIIEEYAEDAIVDLGAPRVGFLAIDHEWVREHGATSLTEIEKATLRLIALRDSRTLSHAAARLGMAPVSLSRWIGRRKMPMPVVS
ncbi:MAG TPA: FHA domain-containing protein [Kofleriaceae bacterium]|jgi:hypothetical protein|nr:FHA domain-containing protein [Kofleriaceae bacterium]